ncbi:MAG: hypothetical protein R3Y28_07680 [Candidatus Gastranaerophilales bacterium]
MKKILLAISILTIINISPIEALGSSANNTFLNNVENAIFGFNYEGESESERLNRIEENVYGESSNKSDNQKISSLKNDLSAQLYGQEITPKVDTFATDDYSENKNLAQNQNSQTSSQAKGVDYPIINKLEIAVFNQEYKTLDLNARLAKLEEKIFNNTYTSDDFSTRVERLQAKISPKEDFRVADNEAMYFNNSPVNLDNLDNNYRRNNQNRNNHMANNYPQDGFDDMSNYNYEDYNYFSSSNGNNSNSISTKKLAKVEKALFKESFKNEDLPDRLSRLENYIFGTSFDENNIDERMNRITSAYQATQSASKYDSNKFTNGASTIAQIGTIILMVLACIL